MSEKEESFDLRSRAGLGEHKTPPSVIHTAGEKKEPKKMKKSTDFSVVKRKTGMLSNDSCTLSTSYKGFSGRADMWLNLLVNSLLQGVSQIVVLVASWCDVDVIIIFAIALILGILNLIYAISYFLPCVIRRSRQLTGSGTYGWIGVYLGVFSSLIAFINPSIILQNILQIVVPYVLFSIAYSVPLYFIGGRYAGAKNELMRAAIEGNKARVKKLVALHIYNLEDRSEKGYTAREYAEKRGFTKIAAYLREMEKQQNSPQDAKEEHSVTPEPASAAEASKVVSINEEATENIATAVEVGTPSTEDPSSVKAPPSPPIKETTSPEVPKHDEDSLSEPKKTGWIWLLVAILVIANMILGAVYIRAWSENAVQKSLMAELQTNIETLEQENSALQTQMQAAHEETYKLLKQLRANEIEQNYMRCENNDLQKRLEEVSAECSERDETVERLCAALVESDKEKEGLRKRVAEPSAEPSKGAVTSTTTAGDAAEMDGILFKNYPYTIFRIKAAQPFTDEYNHSVIIRINREKGKSEAQLIWYDADDKPHILDSCTRTFERYTKHSDMDEVFYVEEDVFNQAKFHYQGPAHIHVVGMGEVSLNAAGNPVRTVTLTQSAYVRLEGLNFREYSFASTGTIEGCHSLDGGSGAGEELKGTKEQQKTAQPSANNASKEEAAAKAKAIVQRFIESQSSDGGDVGYEELHYPVSFLEYGIQDRAFVMSDRQEYKAKFPKRRFIWHDDATVKETEEGKEWQVTTRYHCIVQSAKGKWIGCQMKGSYILRDYPGEGVRINALTEDLVRRYTPTATEISAAFGS